MVWSYLTEPRYVCYLDLCDMELSFLIVTLDKPGYWGVHAIGEVWAQFLWVVLQKLIKKHGYSDDLFPPSPLEDR